MRPRPRWSTASSWCDVEGQTDVAVFGLPHLCPYNVNSIMNPILVMCMGLGYLFNLYRGRPLVREGGVAILSHPTPWAFHPVHHPSYIDFFEEVLSRHHRPDRDREDLRGALRHRRVVPAPVPHQPRLPRRPPLLHVVLGRPRPRASGPGDHRRAASPSRAPAGLLARLHA